MPSLSEVKPWGRSLGEYRAMFDLSAGDLQRRILDCGGGPASFNAEATDGGASVVSCDPIYAFSGEQIQQRIDETAPLISEHVKADRDLYVWKAFSSPEEMIEARLASMERFLADYVDGLKQGRYLPDALPSLPFSKQEFDLALCSHLLFTYSEPLSLEFHLQSIGELARAAREVRVFPLLDSGGSPSPHVDGVMQVLASEGLEVRRQTVAYEFQKGGNEMLVVRARNHGPAGNDRAS